MTHRTYAVNALCRIADPVLTHLAGGSLKSAMPVFHPERTAFAPLEALGRLLSGMAPWLELGEGTDEEGLLREKYGELARRGIARAVDSADPEFMNFTEGKQPLVDTAFLAHALLRSPRELWGRLSPATQRQVMDAFARSLAATKPGENNWLLFAATISAARWQFAGEPDLPSIEYAVKRHLDWYKGDGTYGDGQNLAWDYYNSFVIQPMLVDVLRVCQVKGHALGDPLPTILKRAMRYAEIQERMISPEGTYPIIGRSSVYRFGAFQHLAQMALQKNLPETVKPAAVRCALHAVVKRTLDAPGTFDGAGWLRPGAVGHQPSLAEGYISTGSLYLCATGLLHLGLPAADPLWSDGDAPWTQQRLWQGEDLPGDHALHG